MVSLAGMIAINDLHGWEHYLGLAFTIATSILFSWVLFLVFRAMRGKSMLLAIPVLLTTVCLCAIGQGLVDYGSIIGISQLPDQPRLQHQSVFTIFSGLILYVAIYAANLALFWLSAAHRSQREAEANSLRAELYALRLKLNPHFMFNALNSASALAETGQREDLEALLENLANFLRASFEVGVEDISLREELSLVDDYLAVEGVRFPDRLSVQIDIDPAAVSIRLPSMLLQPLVENAVKYAVAPSMEPVILSIGARAHDGRLHLSVEDEGSAPAPVQPGGTGVGQAATRSRLALRYGEAASFNARPTPKGYRVDIELPAHG